MDKCGKIPMFVDFSALLGYNESVWRLHKIQFFAENTGSFAQLLQNARYDKNCHLLVTLQM